MNDIAEEYSESRGRGQLKLWLLILLAAAPMLLAFIMYFGKIGVPEGSTNNGSLLLPPLQAEEWGWREIQTTDDSFRQTDGHTKWVMLIVGGEACDEHCEQSLYLTRQVNIALGKEMDRVTRLLLAPEEVVGLEPVLREHEGLARLSIDADQLDALKETIGQLGVSFSAFDVLLMDPLGNIMMHYDASEDGKGMLEDLKRLLKVSKIG